MDNVHSFQKLATQYIRPMLANLGQKLKEKQTEEVDGWLGTQGDRYPPVR